jgi:quercetin dioxygenase-like cupin family protein
VPSRLTSEPSLVRIVVARPMPELRSTGKPTFMESQMSSLRRAIEGDVLVQHLRRDEQTIDQSLLARHGRSARTLVKEGPLRLTLIALAAGGSMPSHHADGPVTIHLLEGDAVFGVEERDYPLAPGEVLVLASGVQHGARSSAGCVLLLTVVHLPSPESPASSTQ